MTLDEAITAMRAAPLQPMRRPGWKRMRGVFWDNKRLCFMNEMIDGTVKPCVILHAFENAQDFEWTTRV